MSAAEQAVDRVIEAADRARKERATAAALLAMAPGGGWQLFELADGSLLAVRPGRGRPLRDERDLQAFVRHVAGGA